MIKREAKLYLELVEIASSEGLLSEKAYELGKTVRNKYYPKKYSWVFKEGK